VVIAIDEVTHEPLSEAQFGQFAQQILKVLQRVTAHRRNRSAQPELSAPAEHV